MEKKIFGDMEAYITGSIDTGLLIVEGRVNTGTTLEDAEKAVFEIISDLLQSVNERELAKIKNKAEATLVFSYTDILNKATNLAFFEMLGDASLINVELEGYQKVSLSDLRRCIEKYLRKENASILYYKSIKEE
jgi:predicted Zn-dependent peptidase